MQKSFTDLVFFNQFHFIKQMDTSDQFIGFKDGRQYRREIDRLPPEIGQDGRSADAVIVPVTNFDVKKFKDPPEDC